MSKKNLEDKRSTIIRVVHNRENPFVQLNKEACWDERLSLKAVGLWTRCMSRPNDWKFCIKELIKKCKEGRKAIDSAMKELIEFGYAYRLEYTERSENGKYKTSGVEYVFFEFPATQQEKDEQMEIFKKSFQHSHFGNSRYGNFRKEHLLIKSPTEIHPESKTESLLKVPEEPEERVEKIKPESFSSEVLEITQLMIEAMGIVKPNFSAANGKALGMCNEVDRMIRLDKRTPAEILEVFRWALADSFWADKMFKPNPAKYLREKFDQLEMKMNADLIQPAAPVKKTVEDDKPHLTKRLKGRYTYTIEFGNIVLTSTTAGHFSGKIPLGDKEALESWLRDKGL